MEVLLIYIFVTLPLCFAVSEHGSRREIGYWWTFLISILFTPIVGLIVATASPFTIDISKDWYRHYQDGQLLENRYCFHDARDKYIDALFIRNLGKQKKNDTVKAALQARIAKLDEIIERENLDIVEN